MNTRCDGENGSYDKDFGLFFPQLDGAVLFRRTNQNITVENEMIRAWSVVVSKDTQGISQKQDPPFGSATWLMVFGSSANKIFY